MYNSIVIGAGPGGYVAALRLASKKQKVAIIESSQLGGTCLNTGCIPTKTMLHSSEIVANMNDGAEHGITVNDWKFDLATLIKRKNSVVSKLRSGVAGLLKGCKVDVFSGKAKLIDANTVEVKLNGMGPNARKCTEDLGEKLAAFGRRARSDDLMGDDGASSALSRSAAGSTAPTGRHLRVRACVRHRHVRRLLRWRLVTRSQVPGVRRYVKRRQRWVTRSSPAQASGVRW